MADVVGEGEGELLIDGLSDDVALLWVLIHLGVRGNPPADPGPPTSEQIDDAIAALSRLSDAG
jgi:hypothetical protein